MTPELSDSRILAGLKARAAELRAANGYHYDAGANIYLGRVFDIRADSLPGLVITQPDFDSDVVDEDEDATVVSMSSEFVVEAYAEVSKTDPLPDLMNLRADLLRAFYRPRIDHADTLGGIEVDVRLVSTAKVMPDSGASVGMAQLTLRVEYLETFTGD